MSDKTLWIIDNLTDPDQLNSLLNEIGNVTLLVSSQDSREGLLPAGVVFQPVGVLDPESAVLLLCSNGRHDAKSPVFAEIVGEVGCLPRAVEALAVQLETPLETPDHLLSELRKAPNLLEFDRFQNQTAGLQIPRPEPLFNALKAPVESLSLEMRESLAPLVYTADLPLSITLVEVLTNLCGAGLMKFLNECSRTSILTTEGEQVTIHSLTTAVISATNDCDAIETSLQRTNQRIASLVSSHNLVTSNEISHFEKLLLHARYAVNQNNESLLNFQQSGCRLPTFWSI